MMDIISNRGESLPIDIGYTRRYPCSAPFSPFHVEWNGDVFPCSHIQADLESHKEFILSTVKADSNIFQVWINHSFVTMRKALLNYDIKKFPCTRCNSYVIGDTPVLRAGIERLMADCGLII